MPSFPLNLSLEKISKYIFKFSGYWSPKQPVQPPVQPVIQPQVQPPVQAVVQAVVQPVIQPVVQPIVQSNSTFEINTKGFRIYAPYVDILLWPTINLIDVIKKTGHKFFTLAFIVAGPDNGASWGGVIPLEQKFFIDQINQIRQLGGDIIISLGGLNGTEIAVANNDINKIVEIYQNIIDTYNLKFLDLDIEGFALHDLPSIDRRNKAIKIIQDRNPSLKVAYCLPVVPDGLSNFGIDLLKNAIQNNVRIDLINVMTMNYGSYYSTGKDLGLLSIECAKQTYNQTKSLGIDCEIGLTPMIGVNDITSEVFTLQNAQTMVDFSIKTPWITLTSNWSLNRDTSEPGPLFKSSQIDQKDYDFLNILRKIQEVSTTVPTPTLSSTPVPPAPTPVPPAAAPVPPAAPAPIPVPPAAAPAPVSSNNIWETNKSYNVGEMIIYNEIQYKCLQPHVSNSGWTPEATINVLWIKIIQNKNNNWSFGTKYDIGDEVLYNNVKYKCIQSHMSQTGWTPDATLNILWGKLN